MSPPWNHANPVRESLHRNRNWKERLFLEEETGCGFDQDLANEGGFHLSNIESKRSIRLTGMGPKLLVSDRSTRDQPVLRWQLRVCGNTAVEFGLVPADLQLSSTSLHKCVSLPSDLRARCTGFCSQITAGSLLPLKAPIMRGTVLDIVARRGRLDIVLLYPEDAKEISWHNGQPVQSPYRGPQEIRLEQQFSSDFDVCLAMTAWAKAHVEVLHTGTGSKWTAHEANLNQPLITPPPSDVINHLMDQMIPSSSDVLSSAPMEMDSPSDSSNGHCHLYHDGDTVMDISN